ncbi:hypothetical protein [Dendronalium sp. ChiSLP03b]|nr:hypothetical protein [Dendronalium sp. ChiSLP03b]MDZ8206000.1 hypothetical protein [Dendronalium sp. ChiSLP03b]
MQRTQRQLLARIEGYCINKFYFALTLVVRTLEDLDMPSFVEQMRSQM